MLPESVRKFVTENHHSVLTTLRKTGSSQMSVVFSGPYHDGLAFSTPAGRAKLLNLQRDPRCSLLVSEPGWFGYIVVEGKAVLMSPENTEAEELRLALRDVFRLSSGTEHPDWDEYDQAMLDERRSVVIVVPEHIYGTAL